MKEVDLVNIAKKGKRRMRREMKTTEIETKCVYPGIMGIIVIKFK
jgi:hypothetical protein